ncbi:MAG: hypothetical protein ACTSQ8_20145 [Candidatus Helarchaeota archaeon]
MYSTNKPPFNASAVAATHSQLAGIIAGFSLTAAFLLVDYFVLLQYKGKGESLRKKKLLEKTILLLIIVFILQVLASFLYSSISGDEPDKAYAFYIFPSIVFVTSLFLFLLSMNFFFKAIEVPFIQNYIRRISAPIISLCVMIIASDLSGLYNYFLHVHIHPLLNQYFFFTLPIFLFSIYITLFSTKFQNKLIERVVFWLREKKKRWEKWGYDAMLSYLISSTAICSLGLAIIHSILLSNEYFYSQHPMRWITKASLTGFIIITSIIAGLTLLILPRVESPREKIKTSNYLLNK